MSLSKSLVFASVFAVAILFYALPWFQSSALAISNDTITIAKSVENEGAVSCGRGTSGTFCKICDLLKLAQRITAYIVYIGLSVTTLMIGVGGIMIFIGAYSEKQVETGKEILTNAVVGLLIILFAWFIVNIIIKVMAGGGTDVLKSANPAMFKNLTQPWNEIKGCVNP